MDAANITVADLKPNLEQISAHLYALFAPEFVAAYPDAWIEIAYMLPASGELNQAQNFSAFDLKGAAEFAAAKNEAGYNVYVGAALRHGKEPRSGRANSGHFLAARFAWIEFDQLRDYERIAMTCSHESVFPAMTVITGTTPHRRAHLYFLNAKPITDAAELVEVNTALRDRFGSDDVQDAARVLRLAGTTNYPKPDKIAKGYATELVTLRVQRDAPSYSVEALRALSSAKPPANPFTAYAEAHATTTGKSDDELLALLKATRVPHCWHNSIRDAIASMVGKGWSELAIKLACSLYAEGGIDDPDVQKLIDSAVAKYGEANNGDNVTIKAAEPPTPPQRFLTLDQWRQRDLPPRDLLMGEVFSTTSRALLFAKTGLGKTNFALAMAMRMSAGMSFLHWQGHRKCRALYIDGEMSRSLLKERLAAEEERMLGEVSERVRDQFRPDGFRVLNTEDIEGFQPLNTRQGQAAIDGIIAEIGGIDFIVLDNIMSLIPGPQRDEEPWQKTMRWVHALTKRRIGQMWVHHANDDDKVYGDKTRMWEMDAVIALTEVKRDDTDISFNLSFDKARERKPDNRADFDDTYVFLLDDRWCSDKARAGPSKPPSPLATKYLEALTNVVASGGGDRMKRLHGLVAVHNDDWKAECELLGLLDPKGPANIQRAKFYKYRTELVAANLVACEGEFTWLRTSTQRS
ncbi:AAA family ATPase [Bradyrhizobium sp. Cp5.3]|uniref:AAA family ATPase n=1 Tax=Bradyrhizobium sp. Cp5.3 TaxID=443598 RepID=UPI000427532B|nr:AAA family ATPase [Bradyrhizobium sp. Cp5.3]